MTPRHLDSEPLPRPSRRAIVLGSVVVLAGAVAMGVLGFTSGLQAPPASADVVARIASPASSDAGQLQTLSLTDVRGHKPLGRP